MGIARGKLLGRGAVSSESKSFTSASVTGDESHNFWDEGEFICVAHPLAHDAVSVKHRGAFSGDPQSIVEDPWKGSWVDDTLDPVICELVSMPIPVAFPA